MASAVRSMRRLRQRVLPSAAYLSPPTWVDDPDFDIDLHVRRIACPKPGTLRQVLDMASLVVADPFDRTRPLWQFVVVEGLRGGKAALIQKMHHTITDGERGVELSLQYLDFERDAPERPRFDPETAERAETPQVTPADTIRELVAGTMRIPIGIARQVRELLADPAAIPDASAAAAKTMRGILSQLSDTEGARSPLWTKRSLQRRVEPARAPFRATKDAAKRLGGTLNTAFLTAAADAASAYHIEHGQPVESLRASMAISTRTDDSGANAFTLARLLVPTGEMPIAERFLAIEEATKAARQSTKDAGLDTLAAFTTALPTSLITRLARQQANTVDFATSNVKGSPVPVFVAGAQLLEVYPIGPLGGVAFNLTLMSYLGSLDMALNIDTAAIQSPDLLAACLDRSFKALLRAGKQ
jgi:diacylglycerol O-acyltransferase / wax synthase